MQNCGMWKVTCGIGKCGNGCGMWNSGKLDIDGGLSVHYGGACY